MEEDPGDWRAGVRVTPESPPPRVHPNLNLAPPVHKRALEQIPTPGPQSPSSPHPSSAKRARSAPPEPSSPHTAPAGTHQRPLSRRLAPTRALPGRRLPPSPHQSGTRPGPHSSPVRGARRGAPRGGWGTHAVAALSVSEYTGRAESAPEFARPALQPGGASTPRRDPLGLTCGWARGSPRGPVRRCWATLGSSEPRSVGGEALSPGAQRRAGPAEEEGRARNPGAGSGAGPGGVVRRRGAGPGDPRTRWKVLGRRLRELPQQTKLEPTLARIIKTYK